MKTPPEIQNIELYNELARISSGTLATLTGINLYTKLDKIHIDLITFFVFNQDGNYESWLDVWKAFQNRHDGVNIANKIILSDQEVINDNAKVIALAKAYLELVSRVQNFESSCGEGCQNECNCTFYELDYLKEGY